MWGQEKKEETSSSEQEGKEVDYGCCQFNKYRRGWRTLVPLWGKGSNSRVLSPIVAR